MKKGEDYIGVTVSYLCHDGRGNVVLSKRGPNCRDEHGRWDCGGSSIEFGDTAEATLKKEIKEEYCTEAAEIKFLGFRNVLRTQGEKETHWISLDYCVLVDSAKVKNGEPHKFDAVEWFPFDALPSPMHSQWPMFMEQYKDTLGL